MSQDETASSTSDKIQSDKEVEGVCEEEVERGEYGNKNKSLKDSILNENQERILAQSNFADNSTEEEEDRLNKIKGDDEDKTNCLEESKICNKVVSEQESVSVDEKLFEDFDVKEEMLDVKTFENIAEEREKLSKVNSLDEDFDKERWLEEIQNFEGEVGEDKWLEDNKSSHEEETLEKEDDDDDVEWKEKLLSDARGLKLASTTPKEAHNLNESMTDEILKDKDTFMRMTSEEIGVSGAKRKYELKDKPETNVIDGGSYNDGTAPKKLKELNDEKEKSLSELSFEDIKFQAEQEGVSKQKQLIDVSKLLTISEQNLVARILAQKSKEEREEDIEEELWLDEGREKVTKMEEEMFDDEALLLQEKKSGSYNDIFHKETTPDFIVPENSRMRESPLKKEESEEFEVMDNESQRFKHSSGDEKNFDTGLRPSPAVKTKETAASGALEEELSEKELILERIRKERKSEKPVMEEEIPEYLDDFKDLLVPRARRKKAKTRFTTISQILKVDEPKSETMHAPAMLSKTNEEKNFHLKDSYEQRVSLDEDEQDTLASKDHFLLTADEQRELEQIQAEQEAFKAAQRRDLERFLAMPAALTEQEQRELEELLAEEETDKEAIAASEARLEALLAEVRRRMGESAMDLDDENLDRYMTLPVGLTEEEEKLLSNADEEKGRGDFETDEEYREYIKQRYLDQLEEEKLRVEEEEYEFGEYYDDEDYEYEDDIEYDEELEGDYFVMENEEEEMKEKEVGKEGVSTKDEAVGTDEPIDADGEEKPKRMKKFFSISSLRSKGSSKGSKSSLDRQSSKDSSMEGSAGEESKEHKQSKKFFRFGSLGPVRKKKNEWSHSNDPQNQREVKDEDSESHICPEQSMKFDFGKEINKSFTSLMAQNDLKKERMILLLKCINKYGNERGCLSDDSNKIYYDSLKRLRTLTSVPINQEGDLNHPHVPLTSMNLKDLKNISNFDKKSNVTLDSMPVDASNISTGNDELPESGPEYKTRDDSFPERFEIASSKDDSELKSDPNVPLPHGDISDSVKHGKPPEQTDQPICSNGGFKEEKGTNLDSEIEDQVDKEHMTVANKCEDVSTKVDTENFNPNDAMKEEVGQRDSELGSTNYKGPKMSRKGGGRPAASASMNGLKGATEEELWPEDKSSKVVLDEFQLMEQEVNAQMEKEKKKREGDKKGKKKKKKKGESEKENKKTAIQSKEELYEKHVGPRIRSFDTAKMKNKFNKPKEPTQVSTECRICGKQVFQMEKIVAEKASWHKNCFRCKECNKNLTLETYQSHEGSLYCKPHFKELFRPKAVVQDEAEERKDRSTATPDYGLEELHQTLNVKERFSLFENLNREEERPKAEPISVRRSQSLMSKAARFLDGQDDKPYGDPEGEYEDEDEEDEEEEDEEEEEEEGGEEGSAPIVRSNKKKKERPMSFSGMGDLKAAWEQKQRREEMSQNRKEEISRFRQMLCAGKNSSLKERFESGRFEEGEGEGENPAAKEQIKIDGKRAASSLMKRFEQGQPFILEDDDEEEEEEDDEEDDDDEEGEPKIRRRRRKGRIGSEQQEVEEIFKEAETAKKARNVFKQIDSKVVQEGTTPILRSQSFATSNKDNRRSLDASLLMRQTSIGGGEVVKSSEKSEDFQVDTSDLASRFKFFLNYEKEKEKERETTRKVFRITPPREGVHQNMQGADDCDILGRDPNLIKCTDNYQDDVDCRNTKNILQMFKKMEMGDDDDEEEDEGPRPLKRFTPPPEGADYEDESDEEYSDEEYSDEEEEEDDEEDEEGNKRPKLKDELLEMATPSQSARKAANLRAKFERWEAEVAVQNDINKDRDELEEGMPSLDTAKNLRAMFEHKANEVAKPVASKPITQKVNRFV